MTVRRPLDTALAALRAHPRHVVLAALVAGLLLGRRARRRGGWPRLVARRARWPSRAALLAAAAVLDRPTFADARLAALDAGVLASMHGRTVETRAILLEPVRARERRHVRRAGPRSSTARAAANRPSCAPDAGRRPRARGRGHRLRARARWRRSGSPTRISASATLTRRSSRSVSARPGSGAAGSPGVLDGVRRTAEAGLDRGLDPPEAALLRGMVLGEDERLSEEVREDFQRSGLAHILAVSGSNVMLLAVLVLGCAGCRRAAARAAGAARWR